MLAQRTWKPLLLGVGIGAVVLLAPSTAAQAAPTIDQQIQTQSKQLEKVVEQYNKVSEQLKASQVQAAAIQRKLVPLKVQVDAASVRVNSIAAEAYKGESLSEFSAVVSASDTAEAVDRLVTIAQIGRYENQEIDSLQASQKDLNDQLSTLNTTIANQQAQRKQMADQKAKIQAGLTKLYAMQAQAEPQPKPSYSGAGAKPPAVLR